MKFVIILYAWEKRLGRREGKEEFERWRVLYVLTLYIIHVHVG